MSDRKPWRLLDGAPYVPAVKTDIRETFKRIRREQQKQQQSKVTLIKKRA